MSPFSREAILCGNAPAAKSMSSALGPTWAISPSRGEGPEGPIGRAHYAVGPLDSIGTRQDFYFRPRRRSPTRRSKCLCPPANFLLPDTRPWYALARGYRMAVNPDPIRRSCRRPQWASCVCALRKRGSRFCAPPALRKAAHRAPRGAVLGRGQRRSHPGRRGALAFSPPR